MLHARSLGPVTFGLALFLVACGGAPAAQPAAPSTTTAAPAPAAAAVTETTPQKAAPGEEQASKVDAPYCDLVCQRAAVEKRSGDDPDYHARATENANRVISAMEPDLLACYKKRVRANPNAHGFLTVDVVIGPDGHVLKVETTGGAVLGEATRSCIVQRIQQGVFDPPHKGGTLRIQVPFGFRRVAAGEEV